MQFAGEWLFFNLHLRRTNYSDYLTNLLFLLTKSNHWNVLKKNRYVDLWSYTLYIIWKGVGLLVKLKAGRVNKWTTKIKSLTCISEGFDKCPNATLQNNYFWGTPPDDCFCLEIWSQNHYNIKSRNFKTIFT